MKVSLATLFAITTTFAWVMGLMHVSPENRGLYIGCSFFAIAGLLFYFGLTLRNDSDGKLQYEQSRILSALEPTFKIAGILLGTGFVAIMALLFYVVWVIVSG